MSTRVYIGGVLNGTQGATVEIDLPVFECLRCGHHWSPAKPFRPLRCAFCKSPYWDRERVYRKRHTSGTARRKKPSKS